MTLAMSNALPIEIDASQQRPLGMSAEDFLRDYWQKRPLLIRNAFANFVSPVTPEDMAGLACEEGVLARIIRHDAATDAYSLETGPFDEAMFPDMPHQDWTLLVQDVDKWDADIRELINAFGFLPRWRIDDVMVSFAAPGGSVGAHVDQYDVFLLQAHGQRRWQIDARQTCDLSFRDDAQIKLLKHFTPDHEWVLNPGDMLYLPPGVPHHGVAVDACLTFSLGMRAPASAELLTDWVDEALEHADEAQRYTDPDLQMPNDVWEIDTAALARARAALKPLLEQDDAALGEWFGRFITLYRSVGSRQLPETQANFVVMTEHLAQPQVSLQRDAWTRVAWQRSDKGANLFVAGLTWPLPLADARRIAASPSIDAAGFVALSEQGQHCVHALFQAGIYSLERDDIGDNDAPEDEDIHA